MRTLDPGGRIEHCMRSMVASGAACVFRNVTGGRRSLHVEGWEVHSMSTWHREGGDRTAAHTWAV